MLTAAVYAATNYGGIRSPDAEIVFRQPLENRWEHAVGSLGIDFSRLHSEGGHA